MGVFGKIVDKFRNKNNEEKKYLKIAKEHIDKAGENLTKEQINEMMKLGMDTRELYPEVSKLYFERIEDYFPHASTMLATFYMDKDDEMYEKYCLKAANQGENIAKKSLAIFYAKNNNEEKMLEWYNKLDDKEDYDVLAYMSNYYMFQDNYDKVKEINFTILKNKKDDKYAPNCLGDAYFVEGDFENSEKYYKMALENGSPDSKDKLFNLYQTTENIEKFRELIEKDEENSKKMKLFMEKFEEKENEVKSIGDLLQARKLYDKYLSMETRILSKLENVLIQRDFESFISSGYTLSSLDNVWDIVKIEYKNISKEDKETLKEVFAFFLNQINKRFKEAKYGLVQAEVGKDFDAVNQVDLSQNSRGRVTECVFYGYGFLKEKENPSDEDVVTRTIKSPLVLTA